MRKYLRIFFSIRYQTQLKKNLIQTSFLLIHYQINLLSRHCAAGKLTAQFRGIIWSTSPEPIGDVGLSVRKITAWSRDIDKVGKYPGLKQVSLVSRKEDLDSASFYQYYQRHIDIAREHHGMEKYAQNIDIEYLYGHESHASAIDGISELWFADTSDWFERFYLKEDSQRIVREDTQNLLTFRLRARLWYLKCELGE